MVVLGIKQWWCSGLDTVVVLGIKQWWCCGLNTVVLGIKHSGVGD